MYLVNKGNIIYPPNSHNCGGCHRTRCCLCKLPSYATCSSLQPTVVPAHFVPGWDGELVRIKNYKFSTQYIKSLLLNYYRMSK